jgi:hypothetical protein
MKSLVLLFALVSLNAFAVDIGGSFYEGIVNNMNDIDSLEADVATLEGLKSNFVVLDLNVTATLAAAATVTFPTKAIPANAIIKNSWYEVQTQIVSANTNTLKLECASVVVDAAVDLSSVAANTIAAADITATAATYKNVGASTCTPTFTVGAGASGITAGRIRYFVEYVTR